MPLPPLAALPESELTRHDGCGKVGAACQVAVDACRSGAAFGYRPNDQALAAYHVAAGEDARGRRCERPVDRDIAPGVEPEPELGHAAVDFRSEKAHRDQDEIGLELKRGCGYRLKGRASADRANLNGLGAKRAHRT